MKGKEKKAPKYVYTQMKIFFFAANILNHYQMCHKGNIE